MEIDLNSDVGEGFGPWRMGDDSALMQVISSANIACGYHAGDPVIMDATVRAAGQRGVEIGAHVGFPDLMGFGRRRIDVDPVELAKYVVYQLGALAGIAKAAGQTMTHMSFHGALGNMAAADLALAKPLVRAVVDFDPRLIISVSTGTAIERAADVLGIRVATTFLADRAYDDAGQLVSRKLPGAVIHDAAQVLGRVMQVLQDRSVTSASGKLLPMPVKSILLHGDTAGAVELARSVRTAIESGGGRVVPISRLCA
ncbi:MAG TPA: 5-oxoprolinase subunit PxpA [Burkholderiaceae bacterium]|nr:5-oxoprolinase subunit PxpA [Burkholderiaceae bacterium]